MALQFFDTIISSKNEMTRKIRDEADKIIAGMRPTKGWGASTEKAQEVLYQTALLSRLYDYAFSSDTYRTIIYALQRELFRNGAQWKPKFASKCKACGREYKEKKERCDCGGDVREPDWSQRQIGERFVLKANGNGHSLLEEYSQMEPDFEVMDNAFLIAVKKYEFGTDDEGNENAIIGGEVLEFLRADPLYFRKIINKQGIMGYDFYSGQQAMVCPEHRDHIQSNVKKCKQCGKKLYPAHYQTWQVERPTYYFAGEAIHCTKYTKTLFYGYPAALTVMTKIRSLLAMDELVYRAYYGQKTPKGILLVRTANRDSAEKEWSAYVDRVNKDPVGIYPMFSPPQQKDEGGDPIKWIEFMRTLEEMQYTEVRSEYKQSVGAFFGVMPMFGGDFSTSSGLNSEGLQVTVTNRASECGQGIFNSKVTPFVLAQLGITDWEYVLNPPEEKDVLAELQREAQAISNAQAMQTIGFKVLDRKEDGTFTYSEKPEEKEEAAPPAQEEEAAPPADDNTGRFDGAPERPTS